MLNPTVEESPEAPEQEQEAPASGISKPVAARSKAKAAQPKSESEPSKPVSNGPIYLLLSANGKYKELSEAELQIEAASVLKDPTLRLVKGQYLVPQISFNLTEA
ncbi:MAG TPA: hypothetical protein VJ302_33365 [Blastocatellia bacterium]|nr:hypothetical protein [Blastocatellia bacterium]